MGKHRTMKPELALRTVILAAWLAALIVHADRDLRSGLLAVAITLLWTAPLVRDRLRSRSPAPVRGQVTGSA